MWLRSNPYMLRHLVRNADFCHFGKKGVVFALVISGVTGPISIKFAQYVEKILLLTVFESNCDNWIRYERLNKGHFANSNIVAFSMHTVQLLKSTSLVLLIRISPYFHTMYRNVCWLTCRNQNCDFTIHFGTPGGKWTTIIKSCHNLQFLWGYWTNLDQICTVCGENIAIEYLWIKIAIIESISECQRVE